MSFLAIDPGLDTGWATWDARGAFTGCGLVQDGRIPLGARIALIERPQVYRAAQSKGDPNDLITLAIRVGQYTERLIAAGGAVEHVLPRQWKGTVDPDVMCTRVIRDMSPDEARIALPYVRGFSSKKLHNVIDAIGLGKWAFRSGVWKTTR